MYNISLIFTRHKEGGNCNSFELLKIMEAIGPEIVFEELSLANFDRVYKEKCLVTLESNAIKMYLNNHDIEHIPVDTYGLPKSYYENLSLMLERLTHGRSHESFVLRRLIDDHRISIDLKGFSFLNSDQNDVLVEKINTQREKILEIINDEYLFQIASLEKEVIEKRENEIIDNVYSYSKEHVYNQAILFIGSGHRKAMIKKIEERKTQEKIEINWILLNS